MACCYPSKLYYGIYYVANSWVILWEKAKSIQPMQDQTVILVRKQKQGKLPFVECRTGLLKEAVWVLFTRPSPVT